MSVDYEQQLLDNAEEKKTAIENSNTAYDKTINDYTTKVDEQQQQLKDYEAQQKDLQQQQTDFAIKKIEQQKEQAEKDYTKEQQAAYGDYKRQTDPYGVNAEQMAAMGLSQSGYSESSNVAMYTAYQNRVAAARVSFEQAKQSFANAIQEAKLTNDINKAKIAAETLQQSLKLAMESVVYLGNLEREKLADARAIEQTYYNREQDIRDAQRESMGSGAFSITGDEGVSGVTEDAMKSALAGDYPSGVIADAEIWNALVEEYGEEKIRSWGYKPVNKPIGIQFTQQMQQDLRENFASAVPISDQGMKAGQTGMPKYNYSDERVNAYFTQKDAVEALQKEYDTAVFDLNRMTNQASNYNSPYNLGDNKDDVIKLQQEYVDQLKEQLKEASTKLGNMTPATESSKYKTLESECKKAKEALETAKRELSAMKGSGVSAGARSLAEEKVKNAQEAYDKAYEELMSVDRYVIQERTKGMSDYAGTFRTDRLK